MREYEIIQEFLEIDKDINIEDEVASIVCIVNSSKPLECKIDGIQLVIMKKLGKFMLYSECENLYNKLI